MYYQAITFLQFFFTFISDDLDGAVNGVADDLEKQKINDAQGEGTLVTWIKIGDCCQLQQLETYHQSQLC